MPTPVSAARQCLTEESATVLDDAVSVARRRNHAQTTSLHAISALLSSPSSLLRDACSRARSSAYSPRLQFRALELSVGVSLDRLPSSKNQQDEPPPISNSLMAAIKRSQANQRRQPEMYQFHQFNQHNFNPMSISSIKVELKNFVLSILDDPIVSRVFGEAGFRSCDIKLAIVRPPLLTPVSPGKYLRPPRHPPLFLCNLTDSPYPSPKNIQFPFPGVSDGGDEYCRRIGEVLVRKSGRNPLLVGVCAKDALASFKECLQKGKGAAGLPSEVVGIERVCLEKEITEFILNGGNKEAMNSKFKELSSMVENHSGPGIVVNFGDLKVFVDAGNSDAVKFLVVNLTSLVEIYGQKKLWLIGVAAAYETYLKFLELFPSIERDWDLSALPITSSSKSSGDGIYSKSSLMGSFVPFGGFFTSPPEIRVPPSVSSQPFILCNACSEKCDQELSAIAKGASSVSIADRYSATLPSWLRKAEPDASKGGDSVAPAKDDEPSSSAKNAKPYEVQEKWSDFCQRLHQRPTCQKTESSLARPGPPASVGAHYAGHQGSSSRNIYLSGRECSSIDVQRPMPQISSPEKQDRIASYPSSATKADSPTKLSSEIRQSVPFLSGSSSFPTYPLCKSSLAPHKSSSDDSVTTNLELGVPYASQNQEQKRSVFHDHTKGLQCFSESVPDQDKFKGKNSYGIVRSPCSNVSEIVAHSDYGDYKLLLSKLMENVAWQAEAASRVSQVISGHKMQHAQHGTTISRGDIWLSFLGPDRVGKKKMAEALAGALFGSKESLVAVDLSSQLWMRDSKSIFGSQKSVDYDVKFARKTTVGYIADELKKKMNSVVFLDNIDEADALVQKSLSHAIQTGKFLDSNGREISIMNTIFVTTCTRTQEEKNLGLPNGREFVKFSEEAIMEAESWQMQLTVESNGGGPVASKGCNVSITSDKHQGNVNKRKYLDVGGHAKKIPRNSLDLNVAFEDIEEASEIENDSMDSISDISRAWLEDFLGQVEGKVVFREFNFDALADKLLNKISSNLRKTIGLDVRLVVEYAVMVQILAAAWCSDNKGAVEDWIEQVLGKSFAESQERYQLTERSIIKLVSCASSPADDHRVPGIPLPRTISLH